jgi:hypothetical protein
MPAAAGGHSFLQSVGRVSRSLYCLTTVLAGLSEIFLA